MENLKSSSFTQDTSQTTPTLGIYPQISNNKKQKSLFKCSICSKIFSNSSAIAKHRLTHSEERKYSCPICRKAFKRQDHLNGHKLTHETKRPHGCRFCDKSYSDSRSLRRHYENAHVEEYEKWKLVVSSLKLEDEGIEIDKEMIANCDNDDASAKLVKALWMSYSLEEPKKVSCQVCGKRFKNQPALNGHMRLHGGYSLTGGSELSEKNTSENGSDNITNGPESIYQNKSTRTYRKIKKPKKTKADLNVITDFHTNNYIQGCPSSTLSDNTDTSSYDMKPQRLGSHDLYASSSTNSSRSNLARNDWSTGYDDTNQSSSSYNISLTDNNNPKISSDTNICKKEKFFHQLLTEDQQRLHNACNSNSDQTVRRRHESGFPQFPGFMNPVTSNLMPTSLEVPYQHEIPLNLTCSSNDQPHHKGIMNDGNIEEQNTTITTDYQTNPTGQQSFKAVAYFGNKPLPCTGPFGAHYSPITPAPDAFTLNANCVNNMSLKRRASYQTDSIENGAKFKFDTEITESIDMSKASAASRYNMDVMHSSTFQTWNSNSTTSPHVNMSDSNSQNLPSSDSQSNSLDLFASEQNNSSCLFDFKDNEISAFSMNYPTTSNAEDVGENRQHEEGKKQASSSNGQSERGEKVSLIIDPNAHRVPVVSQDNWIFEKEIIKATKETFFENDEGKNQSGIIYQEDKRLPKKKRRPAPLYIHPNVTGNMSRLRTPLPMDKEKSKFLAPYTPPPMLSPNRKGTGLFYNLKKKSKSFLFRYMNECHSTDYSSENSVSNCNNNDYSKESTNYVEKNIIKSCHYALTVNVKKTSSLAHESAPKSAPLPKVPFGYFNDSSSSLTASNDKEMNSNDEIPIGDSSNVQNSQNTLQPTLPNAFDFDFNEDQLDTNALTQSKGSFYIEDDEDSEEFEDTDGVLSNPIPTINVGNEYQASIPECNYGKKSQDIIEDYSNMESWEKLLWYPENFNDDDPKNKDSLDLLMKIACSAAVRNCGLNMEYAFHLLCKYKGDLEKTLQSLLRDCLVVYDYVYAETTVWSKNEILKFQEGLNEYGRDFYLIAKDMNSCGIEKTVKACVEFYYVWKRMNNPAEVKRYRTNKAKKDKQRKRLEMNRSNNPSEKLDISTPPLKTPNIDIITVDENKTPDPTSNNVGRKKSSEICFELVTPQTSTASVATSIKTYNDKIIHSNDHQIILNQRSALCEECGEILQDEHICSEWLAQNDQCSHTNAQNQRFDPCKFCGRVFFRSKSRMTHMKLHHSINQGSTFKLSTS